MKNEQPFVTSTYFISLIKAWLQGAKTRPEILGETADVLLLPSAEQSDVTQLLTNAAREMNEDFYTDIVDHINHAPDTVPTRPGLIHHLQALLAGEITLSDLLEWATWYNTGEDNLSAGIFGDFIVEFICLDFLPANEEALSPLMCRRILEIIQDPATSPLQQKIAITLLPETEKESFYTFLQNYIRHPLSPEALDQYLLKKFGMEHQSFPYTTALKALPHNPEQLNALLHQVMLS